MTNYCSPDKAALLAGKTDNDFADYWADWIDAEMERYTGLGYKGATRTFLIMGRATSLIYLPSVAQSITSILENQVALVPADWRHNPPSRIISRANTSYLQYLPGSTWTGRWYQGMEYLVTYVEPAVTPATWEFTANYCLGLISLIVDKFTNEGLAVTTSFTGQAGGGQGGQVSSSNSNTFPQIPLQMLMDSIAAGIRKPGY